MFDVARQPGSCARLRVVRVAVGEAGLANQSEMNLSIVFFFFFNSEAETFVVHPVPEGAGVKTRLKSRLLVWLGANLEAPKQRCHNVWFTGSLLDPLGALLASPASLATGQRVCAWQRA